MGGLAKGVNAAHQIHLVKRGDEWQFPEVRWADGEGTSWERLDVLDTESLRDRAAQLRAASTGGSS